MSTTSHIVPKGPSIKLVYERNERWGKSSTGSSIIKTYKWLENRFDNQEGVIFRIAVMVNIHNFADYKAMHQIFVTLLDIWVERLRTFTYFVVSPGQRRNGLSKKAVYVKWTDLSHFQNRHINLRKGIATQLAHRFKGDKWGIGINNVRLCLSIKPFVLAASKWRMNALFSLYHRNQQPYVSQLKNPVTYKFGFEEKHFKSYTTKLPIFNFLSTNYTENLRKI